MDVAGHMIVIVREDNIVVVDGKAAPVDCSVLSNSIHAISWYGESGEISYVQATPPTLVAVPPTYLRSSTEMAIYQPLLSAWEAAMVPPFKITPYDMGGSIANRLGVL
jgi:hypothetical protein